MLYLNNVINIKVLIIFLFIHMKSKRIQPPQILDIKALG